MPQYKKVFDIGTYTGNGGQYRVGIPTLRGVGPTGTQVAGSTRFRRANKNKLTRTFGTPTSSLIWTISIWVKRGALSSTNYFDIMSSSTDASAYYIDHMFNTDKIDFQYGLAGTSGTDVQTTTVVRDTSIWNHVLWSIDLSQATAANRIKIYLNGILQPISGTVPTQNTTTYKFNQNGVVHYIGSESAAGSTTTDFDGYMSQFYFVDGQQLTPSSFGEFNSDGIWQPKAYSGTYGNNGFYLPMNSSSNYATDQSGNGNNWTPTGFNTSTANTTYDIVTDSPTDYLSGSMTTANNAGNYCTLNPNYNGGNTISEGNLKQTGFTGYGITFSTLGMSSGKWYAEATLTAGSVGGTEIGICTQSAPTNNYLGSSAYGWSYNQSNGNKTNNGSGSAYGASYASGDVIGIAFDADAGSLTFYKNGVSQGVAYSGLSSGTYFFAGNTYYTNNYWQWNFGQRAFTYTPPSGYKALNTYNIPRPADSSLWFYGDTPDLMWIKNRSTTGLHTLTDTVRGPGLNLVTSSSAAETSYPAVSEMNKFGMSIINDGTSIVNGSGNSMIYWAWKAGSNTSSTSVTNTDGTITSQVSANRQAGFSIVSATAPASGAFTYGHGLGAAPNFIIVKSRSGGTANWGCYHSTLGIGYHINLNLTDAATASSYWGTMSSTVVNNLATNLYNASYPFVAYCWTAIPGYSAFGSFTGNGSTNGPFIYTGFRPRWLLVKRTDSTSNWEIVDTTRDTYNQSYLDLSANLTNAENVDGTAWDILSNGFKIRDGSSTGTKNVSTATYIYAAFAEIPFKYARAR